jgi:membrane protein
MFRDHLKRVTDWMKRVVTQPQGELTRWQRAARFGYDLGRYGARQLREDRATEMAAALAFRTLFAVFPVVVVGMVIYQGLRGVEHFHELVTEIVDRAGFYDVEVVASEPSPEALPPDPPHEAVTLGDWVQRFVAQVADVRLETLGWIGLLVVIYAAVTMMVTIEDAFNTIYRAPEGRSWVRRIPVYWTILTMGPLAIGGIFFIDARMDAWMQQADAWEWTLSFIRMAWGLGVIWLALFAMFVLAPNTTIAWRPAMVGAFVAAIGLLLGKEFLAGYIATFLTVRQLFGALGFVPLFMFWVYVMWLVVLFGLEVSASLQMVGPRRHIEEMEERRQQRTGMLDPASILLVMEAVAQRFNEGKMTTTRRLAEMTDMPEAMVSHMIDRLCRAELVCRVESEEGAVTLARPPEQITADRLMEIGFGLTDETDAMRRSELLRKLREAQRDLTRDTTLATLVAAGASPDGNGPNDSQE